MWNDSRSTFTDDDVVVCRTVWDYQHNKDTFLAFLEVLPCKVFNSRSVLEWSSSKMYLFDLQKAGVPIVPTLLLASLDSLEKPLFGPACGCVVVKPIVGSLGESVVRVQLPVSSKKDVKHLSAMLLSKTCIVQPFVSSIPHRGEVSCIYFNQRFSHAVLKTPPRNDFKG